MKYPIVIQDNLSDCGICSLKMIINYYQGNIPIHVIRKETKTNKYGTTALNIVNYANKIGFESTGYKCTIDNLKEIKLPIIAHMVKNEYYHYIVIYEIHDNYILLADPSKGIEKINYDEFNKYWDNIIITFKPKRKLEYIPEVKTITYVKNNIKLYYSIILKLILTSIIITILGILSSFLFEKLIDNQEYNKLTSTLLFFFVIYIVSTQISFIRNYLLIKYNKEFDEKITIEIFSNIIDLPYNIYAQYTSGDIINRINDLESYKKLITNSLITIILDSVLATISLAVLIYLNPKLSIISVITFITYLIIICIFDKHIKVKIKKIQKIKSNNMSFIIESITNYATIKSNNIEKYIKNRFKTDYYNLTEKIKEYNMIVNLESYIKEIISYTSEIIILILGITSINKGNYTMGRLITFYTLMIYFLEPLKNMITSNVSIEEGIQALKRILEFQFYLHKESGQKEIFGDIKFENIYFTYDKKSALHNINFKLKQGENVMITGNSGSGKSTLFKLLVRYYNLDSGKIKIGDINIEEYDRRAIRKYIVYVSQDEKLFRGSIPENITFGESGIDYKYAMDNALIKNDKIILEENGDNLSGGEKERIILARALSRADHFLILDETLNQVDISMERKIIKNIINNYPQITLIMISHRLDNLDLFDKMIRFENGGIKEIKYKERSIYG